MSVPLDRPVVRWTRWLDRHPVAHGLSLLTIAIAVATRRFTNVTPLAVLAGLMIGVLLTAYFRFIAMPAARRSIDEELD